MSYPLLVVHDGRDYLDYASMKVVLDNQSGSFIYSDPAVHHGEGSAFDPVVRFVDDYRAAPVRAAARAFISCGGYEDLVEANRRMLPIFRSTGMKINYCESRDGHSWESWRDQLGPGLCWLFPGDSGG